MIDINKLDSFFMNVFERPSLYQFSEESKNNIKTTCKSFLHSILKRSDDYSEDFIQKAINKLEWLENTLFLNVNPSKVVPQEFQQNYDYHWGKTQHATSTHLEIGTWTAWPDHKVNEYIRNERIGDFIRLDMDHSFQPDLAASATAIPLKEYSVDRVSSNSLFEHVAYPHEILKEVYRILRPGGVFYTAVPFHFVQHDCPSDYLRYTGAFFKDVCSDIGFSEIYLDIQSTSGVYYTIHNLAKAAIVEPTLPDLQRTIAQEFHTSMLLLLAILQSLDDHFVAQGASHWHTTHVIAIKQGEYTHRSEPLDREKSFVERWEDFFISPDNGRKLLVKGDQLITSDNSINYPIINGTPVLLPKMSSSHSIIKS